MPHFGRSLPSHNVVGVSNEPAEPSAAVDPVSPDSAEGEFSRAVSNNCARLQEEVEELGEFASYVDFVTKGPEAHEAFTGAIATASGFEPSDSMQRDFDQFIDLGNQSAAVFQEMIDAAAAGDDAAFSDGGALDVQSKAVVVQLNAP